MKAAAIGIQTPPKGKIGALVAAQDCTGRVVIDFERDTSRRFQQFPVAGLKGILWICDHAHALSFPAEPLFVKPAVGSKLTPLGTDARVRPA